MRAIGRELRAICAEIIAEGTPKRFAEVLRKLDKASNEGETRWRSYYAHERIEGQEPPPD